MKLTSLVPAFAAILGLALAGAPVTLQAQTAETNAPSATAPTTPAATKPAKAKKPQAPTYKGTLTTIDTTANTIVVQIAATKKDPAKTLTMAITTTTKYQKDKKTATLADFAAGDAVSGSYTKNADGSLVANSLHKFTPKAPKAATTVAPAAPAASPAPAAAPAPAPAAPAVQ